MTVYQVYVIIKGGFTLDFSSVLEVHLKCTSSGLTCVFFT